VRRRHKKSGGVKRLHDYDVSCTALQPEQLVACGCVCCFGTLRTVDGLDELIESSLEMDEQLDKIDKSIGRIEQAWDYLAAKRAERRSPTAPA
jgi:hypothetical protein